MELEDLGWDGGAVASAEARCSANRVMRPRSAL